MPHDGSGLENPRLHSRVPEIVPYLSRVCLIGRTSKFQLPFAQSTSGIPHLIRLTFMCHSRQRAPSSRPARLIPLRRYCASGSPTTGTSGQPLQPTYSVFKDKHPRPVWLPGIVVAFTSGEPVNLSMSRREDPLRAGRIHVCPERVLLRPTTAANPSGALSPPSAIRRPGRLFTLDSVKNGSHPQIRADPRTLTARERLVRQGFQRTKVDPGLDSVQPTTPFRRCPSQGFD